MDQLHIDRETSPHITLCMFNFLFEEFVLQTEGGELFLMYLIAVSCWADYTLMFYSFTL